MSVPVKHHTRGKVGRRRSHLALKATSLQACSECKAPVLPHRVCANCGAMQTRSLRKARAAQATEAPAKKTKASAKKEEPVVAEAETATETDAAAEEQPEKATE